MSTARLLVAWTAASAVWLRTRWAQRSGSLPVTGAFAALFSVLSEKPQTAYTTS